MVFGQKISLGVSFRTVVTVVITLMVWVMALLSVDAFSMDADAPEEIDGFLANRAAWVEQGITQGYGFYAADGTLMPMPTDQLLLQQLQQHNMQLTADLEAANQQVATLTPPPPAGLLPDPTFSDVTLTHRRVRNLTMAAGLLTTTTGLAIAAIIDPVLGGTIAGIGLNTGFVRSLAAFINPSPYTARFQPVQILGRNFTDFEDPLFRLKGIVNNTAMVFVGNYVGLAIKLGVIAIYGGEMPDIAGEALQVAGTSAGVVAADRFHAIPAIVRINNMPLGGHARQVWDAALIPYTLFVVVGSLIGSLGNNLLGFDFASPINSGIYPLSFAALSWHIAPGNFNRGSNIARFGGAGVVTAIATCVIWAATR